MHGERQPGARRGAMRKAPSATRLENDGATNGTASDARVASTAAAAAAVASAASAASTASTANAHMVASPAGQGSVRRKGLPRNRSLPSVSVASKSRFGSNDTEDTQGGHIDADFGHSPFNMARHSSNSSTFSFRRGGPARSSYTATRSNVNGGSRDHTSRNGADARSSSFGGAVGEAVKRSSSVWLRRQNDSFSTARAASTGAAGGDVSFLYTSGIRLDPLLLLLKMPVTIAGRVWIRRAPRLMVLWRPFWAEIRGSMLLLYDADMGELASENAAQGDGLLRGSGAPVLALCSLTGALVSTKLEKKSRSSTRSSSTPASPYGQPPRERYFVLSKQTGANQASRNNNRNVVDLELRAATRELSDKWELALTTAASVRRVGIHDFKQVGALGHGASGKVFAVRDRLTGEYLAMKVIKKDQVFNSALEFRSYMDERVLLQLIHGFPFAVRLRYCFQTERRLYVVTELAEGGDLANMLRKNGARSPMLEGTVRRLTAEIVLVLEFLHSRGFVYRDLKPQNVLLGADGHVQLADFGLCKQLAGGREAGRTRSLCGTRSFAAPEMLTQEDPYGTSVDVWSLGVLLFTMLRGELPYSGEDSDAVLSSIRSTTLRFHENCSPAVVDLVRHLLDRNPNTRFGSGGDGLLSSLREHAFFHGINWDGILAREDHPDNLQAFDDSEHQMRFRPRRRRESLEQRMTRESIEMSGEAPNFAIRELDHIKPDPDENDEAYSDTALWPLLVLGRDRIPDYVVVGNFYSKPREATRCLI